MIEDLTSYSIKDWLEHVQGCKFTDIGGGKYLTRSPFSRDTTPSFVVYTRTNSFYCFSTGKGGNLINLVAALYKCSNSEAAAIIKQNNFQFKKIISKDSTQDEKEFNYLDFINHNKEEVKQIHAYAKARGIKTGYEPGVVFQKNSEKDFWERCPSLMFKHQDENGNICGAKFRKIKEEQGRYTARGRLSFYLLEQKSSAGFLPAELFVVEGEINANSLMEILRTEPLTYLGVASWGSVSTPPKGLPKKLQHIKPKIIIDFDGNEKLWNERMEKYKALNGVPIKLHLPKGEDINSLYVKNKTNLITTLLLK